MVADNKTLSSAISARRPIAHRTRRRALFISGGVALGLGLPLVLTGLIGAATWPGAVPYDQCAGLCIDYKPAAWTIFGVGAGLEALGIALVVGGATTR